MQALPPPPPAAVAQVLAARAYDRASVLDSARILYEASAKLLPSVADWLWLRAAGVTSDSAARKRDYAAVSEPVARGRIPWTEAQARERTGDFAGAARMYDSLGAHADALRNTAALVSATGDSGARTALRAEIFAVIATHSGSADARGATDLADRLFAPLTLAEERTIARSAAVSGPLARAALAFQRLGAPALASPSSDSGLSPPELFTYGTVLQRLRDDPEAGRAYQGVVTAASRRPTDAALARAAQYQLARVLVAGGDRKRARAMLRAVVRSSARDTTVADALVLLADIATDDRDDRSARAAYEEVVRRFPKSPLAPRARFRAALITYLSGGVRTAAAQWDALVARDPKSDESTASRYWSGRAWARAGRRAVSASRWAAVMHDDPLSYYATLSARRLGLSRSLPAPFPDLARADSVPPATDSALARAFVLQKLGMALEEKWEADRAIRAAGDHPSNMIAAGMACVRAGEAPHAIAVAWRLVGRPGPAGDSARRDPRVYKLLYPLVYRDDLVADARAKGLDPALVAAVIRQESQFNPRAVSVVGARGLMQVMPDIGRGLTRALIAALPSSTSVVAAAPAPSPGSEAAHTQEAWDASVLDDPKINLLAGVAHLATFIAQEAGDTVRALAAYNAGPSRVALWEGRRGASDPEVFIERIPFAETRDYVRAIVRGRDVYATIYGPSLSGG